jgi:hypothetical protein
MVKVLLAHDFRKSFTIAEASALIAGTKATFAPHIVEEIAKRLQDDVHKRLLVAVDGYIARGELFRWLNASNVKSEYVFANLGDPSDQAFDDGTDPSDLPVELDAANMAFRAVTNGFGNKSTTFKKRLVEYLTANYGDFKLEQIERIATVANPDKSPGRKKNNQE